jgi:hypothetical protein
MKRIIVLSIMAILAATLPLSAAELYGIVSDKAGKPAQAKLILKDAAGAPVGAPINTDKTGAYTFKDIKPASYQVLIGEKNNWTIFVGPGKTRRDFQLK